MTKIDLEALSMPRPAVPRSLYMRLLHESSLPSSTRWVLATIAWSARADGTSSYLSVTAISSRTGLGDRHCQRIIRSAISMGWLGASPRPGRTNDWLLAAPAATLEGWSPGRGGVTPRPGGGDTQTTRRKNLGRTQEVRARVARRKWCGGCAEDTRLLQPVEGGPMRRCPECHPQVEPLRGTAKPARSAPRSGAGK